MADIADRVGQLRRERKMTIKDLADKIDYSEGSLKYLHRGCNSIRLVQTIADYFNVSVDWLIGRTDDRELHV